MQGDHVSKRDSVRAVGASLFLLGEPDSLDHHRHPGWGLESTLAGRFAASSVGSLSVMHS